MAGLKALDKYTLQITLTRSDLNFPYILAYVAFSGAAREVVEYYGNRIGQHPGGTGHTSYINMCRGVVLN